VKSFTVKRKASTVSAETLLGAVVVWSAVVESTGNVLGLGGYPLGLLLKNSQVYFRVLPSGSQELWPVR
jgi:hypothetical protein